MQRKILWDKINKRECNHQYFFDQYDECYINTNPFGANINGRIEIRFISEDDIQYEIKKIEE